MNRVKIEPRIKEYIYDDKNEQYYYDLWWFNKHCLVVPIECGYTKKEKYALNIHKYWIFKYVILIFARYMTKNKKLRIRKFINYEPTHYCF